jgi:hypothetical protein
MLHLSSSWHGRARLALVLAPWLACAGPDSAAKPTGLQPVAFPPELAGLALRLHSDTTDIGREAVQALGVELAHANLTVLADAQRPADLDLRLAVDLRSIGIAVEGVTSLSAESGGVLIDRVSTSLDVYRRDTYAASVARQLADALAGSTRLRAFAVSRRAAPPVAPAPEAMPADAGPPAPIAAGQTPLPEAAGSPSPSSGTTPPPVPPAASPPPPVTSPPPPPSPAPSASGASPAPPTLGKSGRFGLGLALEADLGWAEAITSKAAVAGGVVALALQFDIGPRAAFRLPLSFAFGGSGYTLFGQLALSPALLYRFRSQLDQDWVPYVGLGLRLGSGLAGRRLLGRPELGPGVTGPDSCPDSVKHPRDPTQPVPDCALFVSPEPMVGVEWHSSRLFSLDIAASYSFAHFGSSEGTPRWLSLIQLYLGPRVSF